MKMDTRAVWDLQSRTVGLGILNPLPLLSDLTFEPAVLKTHTFLFYTPYFLLPLAKQISIKTNQDQY